MEYEIEQDGGAWTFRPAGSIRIDDSQRLQSMLLDAMSRHDDISIDVTGLEHIDLSVMQIFCSAHRTATVRGKRFAFSGNRQPCLAQTIRLMGFDRETGCRLDQTKTCIWKGWDN